MKRTYFFILLIFSGFLLQAQPKIGHISINELVAAMPEYKKASTDLDEYEKALIQMGQERQAQHARYDSIYKADSANWNAAQKDVKKTELNALYLKLINFNQEAQQMMQKREQELMNPITQKALQTAQAVAKENGYSYILNKEQLIAFPPSDDILPLALKKLNITPPAPEVKK
jgi:outer membrane protein